jgi:hypothetical protein
MPSEGIHRRAQGARNECDANRREKRHRCATTEDGTAGGEADQQGANKEPRRAAGVKSRETLNRPCGRGGEWDAPQDMSCGTTDKRNNASFFGQGSVDAWPAVQSDTAAPTSSNNVAAYAELPVGGNLTTIIIRSLPPAVVSQDIARAWLDGLGFEELYDFLEFVPGLGSDRGSGGRNASPATQYVSYAFVNFVDAAAAQLCFDTLNGKAMQEGEPLISVVGARVQACKEHFMTFAEIDRCAPWVRLVTTAASTGEDEAMHSNAERMAFGNMERGLPPGLRSRQRRGGSTSSAVQPRHCPQHGRDAQRAPCCPAGDSGGGCPVSSGWVGGSPTSSHVSPLTHLPPSAADARDARPAAPARGRGRARQCERPARGRRRDGRAARGEGDQLERGGLERGADGGGEPSCDAAAGGGHSSGSHGGQAGAQIVQERTEVSVEDSGRRARGTEQHGRQGGGGRRERRARADDDAPSGTDMGGGGPNRDARIAASELGGDEPAGVVDPRAPSLAEADSHGLRNADERTNSSGVNQGDGGALCPADVRTFGIGGAANAIKRRRLRGKQSVGDGLDMNSLHAEFSGGPLRSNTFTLQRCLAHERDGPLLTSGGADASSSGATAAGHHRGQGGDSACWTSCGGRPPDAAR